MLIFLICSCVSCGEQEEGLQPLKKILISKGKDLECVVNYADVYVHSKITYTQDAGLAVTVQRLNKDLRVNTAKESDFLQAVQVIDDLGLLFFKLNSNDVREVYVTEKGVNYAALITPKSLLIWDKESLEFLGAYKGGMSMAISKKTVKS